MVLTIKFDVVKSDDIFRQIATYAANSTTIEQLSKIKKSNILCALFYNSRTPLHIKEQIKEVWPDVSWTAFLDGDGPIKLTHTITPYVELTLNFDELPISLASDILAYHITDEKNIIDAAQTDNVQFIRALIININTPKSVRELFFNKCRDFIDCYALKERLMCMPLNSNTIRMLIETDIEKKTSTCFSEMLQQEDVSSEDLMIMVVALSECCSPSLAKTIACNIINHPKCNDAIFDKAILHLTR